MEDLDNETMNAVRKVRRLLMEVVSWTYRAMPDADTRDEILTNQIPDLLRRIGYVYSLQEFRNSKKDTVKQAQENEDMVEIARREGGI